VGARLFGPIEVAAGGRRLGPRDLGGPKATQVLELLLVARGHYVTKDRLADQLWREFVTRITRLRCTYDRLVPELAPLMSQAVADDGVVAAQPQVAAVPEDAQRRMASW
jgi:hypothetical protein